ncbi:hypothetical protein DXG01_003948 [Tephrocybe rancida]|nr:hypothetical protein DXG01_003948 [Tephrocybe rancida]
MTPDERQLLQRIGHGLLFIDIFPNVAINLTFGVAVVALLALATVTALETWNTIKLLTVFEKSSLSLIERITSLNLYSAKISVTYDWLTLVPVGSQSMSD